MFFKIVSMFEPQPTIEFWKNFIIKSVERRSIFHINSCLWSIKMKLLLFLKQITVENKLFYMMSTPSHLVM